MKNIIKKILTWLKAKYNDCFFIGSTDILPPPLSKEEELSYLIKAQNGDEFARNKLVEHNLRLVVFLAKKYENTGYDEEILEISKQEDIADTLVQRAVELGGVDNVTVVLACL